jgi:putative mRNA 3-end processing factor
MPDLLTVTERGLYCEAGDFYIDPWRPVSRAVITHAHSDHARAGMGKYFCSAPGVGVLQHRVGKDSPIHGIPYGEEHQINGVKVSLHPAGHVLGSAQVRVEHHGEIWVASGDYKVAADPTCAQFEPVKCHTFISESTFGLPIYRWQPSEAIFAEINRWWADNTAHERTSVLFGYSLGKAQRLLAGVDASVGPILVHGAVDAFLPLYKAEGVQLPETQLATVDAAKATRGRALVVAPPSADAESWMRRFGEVSLAAASGWMQIRGTRRRAAADRGFALSDHADWDGLHQAIKATGCTRVLVTHGYTQPMVRWLREQGYQADTLATHYAEEESEEGLLKADLSAEIPAKSE